MTYLHWATCHNIPSICIERLRLSQNNDDDNNNNTLNNQILHVATHQLPSIVTKIVAS